MEYQKQKYTEQSMVVLNTSERLKAKEIRNSHYLWEKVRKNKKQIINHTYRASNKFIAIIEILNKNPKIMEKCIYEIRRTSIKYPPQKNEMKFIYGKLIEKALISAFTEIGLECIDLDKNHNIGSEYKNDIKLLRIPISIKAKLNKGGDIIMINKKTNRIQHIMEIDTIVCVINEGKIYFIPSNIVNNDIYVKNNESCISYKSSLITMINKKYGEYIYRFPPLSQEYLSLLNNEKEVDIFEKLYLESIKLL